MEIRTDGIVDKPFLVLWFVFGLIAEYDVIIPAPLELHECTHTVSAIVKISISTLGKIYLRGRIVNV